MILQLLFVLTAIIIGARLGGIGLGVMGGVGLGILTFVFGLQPTAPPIDVMLMIAAVISAASCMQAAGGLDPQSHRNLFIYFRSRNRTRCLLCPSRHSRSCDRNQNQTRASVGYCGYRFTASHHGKSYFGSHGGTAWPARRIRHHFIRYTQNNDSCDDSRRAGRSTVLHACGKRTD